MNYFVAVVVAVVVVVVTTIIIIIKIIIDGNTFRCLINSVYIYFRLYCSLSMV